MLFDRLFESNGGYLLDFSNRTLAEFFDEELNIDIEDEIYKEDGDSKAKRVRCLMRISDRDTVIRVVNALWSYKQQTFPGSAQRDQSDFYNLVERLSAVNSQDAIGKEPVQAYIGVNYTALTDEMNAIKMIQPHLRGYRFEAWLKELFAVFRLQPREAFRNPGEQIDGSFEMNSEYYLMEAKWQKEPTAAADLHTFDGKLRQKASWTRGVFISWMGYSETGLQAFGRGHRIICVSGADLFYSLSDKIPFPVLLDAKIRQASESGRCYVPYHELPEFSSHDLKLKR